MARPSARQAPEILGFEYVRELGGGGFSQVYLYQQKLPRRQVAIKVLRVDSLDRQARKQFVAEANLMAQLSSHPAIATIYSAGITDDDQPYFVMEYCSGGSLALGYRTAPLPVAEVLRIGVRVASALESAHRVGIIHRDVKPANILITDYGTPVLTDFGISIGDDGVAEATMFHGDPATATTVAGSGSQGLSIPWAPPEALDDEPSSDERSDIYSLGATLYTLLEGRSPFEIPGVSNGAAQLLRRIEKGEPQALSRPEVPESLRDVIAASMAREPGARPTTALALAESLQEVERELGLATTPLEVRSVAEDTVVVEKVASPQLSQADMQTVLRPKARVPEETAPRAPATQLDAAPDEIIERPLLKTPELTARWKRRTRRQILIGVVALAVVIAATQVAPLLQSVISEAQAAADASARSPEESLELARDALEQFADANGGSYDADLADLKTFGYEPGTNVVETTIHRGDREADGADGAAYCISVKVTGIGGGPYSIFPSGAAEHVACSERGYGESDTPTASTPVSIPECGSEYFSALDEFYADASYSFEYFPLTEIWVPVVLDPRLTIVCGYQSTDNSGISDQMLFVQGDQAQIAILSDLLADEYECSPDNFDGVDCAAGPHHVGLTPYPLLEDELLAGDVVGIYISAFTWCADDHNCVAPELW